MKMREILKKVAENNKVSEDEALDEMQKAIDYAWANPPKDDGLTIMRQQQVPCEGKIPTPEELICFIIEKINTRLKE